MKPITGLIILLVVASCHTMHQTVNLPSFDSEAHRGGRGLMPENTIPAMLHALDLGITTLEMDAVITADRQVILSHEPFFNKEITSRKDGAPLPSGNSKELNIYSMSYQETQQYDVGLKPHPRFPKSEPLTDGVFHPKPAEFVALLLKVIQSKGISERVIIQSFDFRTLRIIHEHYPAIKTAALVADRKLQPDSVVTSLGFSPTLYSPEFSMVDKELVDLCHSKGMKILPWTVNSAAQIRRLKEMGVDGIISDFPDLFRE